MERGGGGAEARRPLWRASERDVSRLRSSALRLTTHGKGLSRLVVRDQLKLADWSELVGAKRENPFALQPQQCALRKICSFEELC